MHLGVHDCFVWFFSLDPYGSLNMIRPLCLLICMITHPSLPGVIMSLLSKLVSPDLARGTFNSGKHTLQTDK